MSRFQMLSYALLSYTSRVSFRNSGAFFAYATRIPTVSSPPPATAHAPLRKRIFQKRRMITGQSGNLAFQYLTP